jgi:hypothetical protein
VRQKINDSPAVQIGLFAVLVLVVGFLFVTRVANKSSSSSSDTSTSAASVAPGTAAPTDSTGAAATTPGSTAATPSATAPSTAAPAVPATGAAAPGEFVAGPGLPAPVVNAYKENKVVVLLVVRRGGIDDSAVKASVERMTGEPSVAVFVTNAGHVSRYSRIAAGVNLDRVPALIVLKPKKLTHGTPVATVSYGFRGPDSVGQAVRDALYRGRTNLPYYPK